MGTDTLTFRKGLNNWGSAREAAFDSAMASGIDSSLDIPNAHTFGSTIEQSATLHFFAHNMRLDPRPGEAGVLDKLNSQIDALLKKSFGEIDSFIANFFERVDDFSKLDPMELERTILQVQRVIYEATETVSSLYNDAYFADRVQQDEYWAAYREFSTEDRKATIQDRQSYAYERTRDSRFYYYFLYLLWKRLSEKLSALRDLQRTLEFFRNRALKDRPF